MVLIWTSKVGDFKLSAKTIFGTKDVKNMRVIIEVIRYIIFIFWSNEGMENIF